MRLSGKSITKPASIVNKGSQVLIDKDLVIKTILVEEIASKRVSFEKAKRFYKVISKDNREAATFFHVEVKYKPDKRGRRNIKALKEKLHFLSNN